MMTKYLAARGANNLMMNGTSDDDLRRSTNSLPSGVEIPLHRLRRGDVFVFVDRQAAIERSKKVSLPIGQLKVSIPPWGPKSPMIGPIGPWMFACRDERGTEHHFALPPQMAVCRLRNGTPN
jgi:hypothetical protein